MEQLGRIAAVPWSFGELVPGSSETSFFRHRNAALETSFTVVQWDREAAVVRR